MNEVHLKKKISREKSYMGRNVTGRNFNWEKCYRGRNVTGRNVTGRNVTGRNVSGRNVVHPFFNISHMTFSVAKIVSSKTINIATSEVDK